MAESITPAWLIPIQKTKLVTKNPQNTGRLSPVSPIPLTITSTHAAIAANSTAAIDIRLIAVLLRVAARGSLAYARRANVAVTVAVHTTNLARDARRAATAAVDVGFVTVQDKVAAPRGLASAGAHRAQAIRARVAELAGAAGGAHPATAIHTGFGTVRDSVAARRSLTHRS